MSDLHLTLTREEFLNWLATWRIEFNEASMVDFLRKGFVGLDTYTNEELIKEWEKERQCDAEAQFEDLKSYIGRLWDMEIDFSQYDGNVVLELVDEL